MIDWSKVYKLKPQEFSEDPDEYADPILIHNLGVIRRYTNEKMLPSPVFGALARFKGSDTSQHFVGPKDNLIRKSTASDVFCEGSPFANYSVILASGLFNGIGVYLDTKGPDGKPWVMFHLDIRKHGFNDLTPLIWIVEKVFDPIKNKKVDKYRYPQVLTKYWELFNDKRFHFVKKFGS